MCQLVRLLLNNCRVASRPSPALSRPASSFHPQCLLEHLQPVCLPVVAYEAQKGTIRSRAHLQCTRRRGAVLVSFQFVEWFDTILLVARYKRITSLHLFHHATAPLITIFNTRNDLPTPLYDIGTTLNAFVHFFMYAFYADPVNLRFLKKFITSIQILQHGVVVSLLCFTLCMQSCDAPLEIYGFSLLCYGVYLGLFLHFYTTRYSGAAAAR